MQASDLNIKIDQLTIKEEDVTIIKYDPEAMYPLIKLKLVIKAVNYFGKRLGKSQKKRIKDCLEIGKFGMTSIMLSFKDEFYGYNQNRINDKGVDNRKV